MNLSAYVKLKRRGRPMRTLVSSADLSLAHLSKIERGEQANPTVAVIAELARALGVPPVKVFEAALTGYEESRNAK